MSLSLGGWVNATGGKTTVMRQAQEQTKSKGREAKACLREIRSLTRSTLKTHMKWASECACLFMNNRITFNRGQVKLYIYTAAFSTL